MYIVDGILSVPVLVAGVGGSVIGIIHGLRILSPKNISKVAVLSGIFFTISLIHIPLGPSYARFLLLGLMGMLLGWAIFPSIALVLGLQAGFFGFGGITVLGINTLVLALPAVVIGQLCRWCLNYSPWPRIAFIWGALAGAGALAGSVSCVVLALVASDHTLLPVAIVIVIGHLPMMGLEALIISLVIHSLVRHHPTLLGFSHGYTSDK